MITKVLIGFDGTECANRALDFGLNLAEKYSASVLIMNVLEPPPYTNPDNPLATSAGMIGFAEDQRKSHQDLLNGAVEKAASLYPKLNITSDLREGNPPAQIVAVADEGNFDVIVVGHGGASRIQELFLGGTSERIAHLARCAVLIVK